MNPNQKALIGFVGSGCLVSLVLGGAFVGIVYAAGWLIDYLLGAG